VVLVVEIIVGFLLVDQHHQSYTKRKLRSNKQHFLNDYRIPKKAQARSPPREKEVRGAYERFDDMADYRFLATYSLPYLGPGDQAQLTQQPGHEKRQPNQPWLEQLLATRDFLISCFIK
jgi:hypothetical protein